MAITKPLQPIILYRHPLSGHCHRVELMLSVLELPYRMIDIDLQAGQHKHEDFLAINPFGQVPVIDDNGLLLYDSNAILIYLASAYDSGKWLPHDAISMARVQQWLSLAAGQIAAGPAAARLINLFGAKLDQTRAQSIAGNTFTVINKLLSQRPYAIGETPSIADIACYGYIAHAPEGGISLAPYPHIENWLRRIEALPNFVPMKASPVSRQEAA